MVPQFKKLTDCPENLRESIDWLIQVRHGGNKDGKSGIDELAGALKKLIEEAIEKATKSLEKRRKQLECPEKYYSGKRDESFCTETEKQINTLKSEIKKLNGSAKSKKEKELKKLQFEHDEHINKDHSLDKSTRDAQIEEQNNNFKKLKKSLEAFIGKENNNGECEKILKKLCDGLQTFLGYDETSKGFTGDGIVYSDLDRLCDAVMAFLKGVLESVKDDDAVKTYDKYINNEGEKFEKVLAALKSSIGRGSANFCDRVREVSEWLGRFTVELNGKIGSITGPLYGLKTHIEKELRAFEKEDPKCSKSIKSGESYGEAFNVKNVETIVERCLLKAKICIKAIFETDKSGLQALDPELQSKIHEPLKKIKKEFARFRVFSAKDEMRFVTMKNTIEKQLNELNDKVNEDVRSRVEALKQHLTSEFTKNIRNPISQVQTALQSLFDDIERWIERAKKIAKNGFEQAEAILKEVKRKEGTSKTPGEGADQWSEVVNAANTMMQKAQDLYVAAKNTKKQLPILVSTALHTVNTLDTELKQDLMTVKKAINAWTKDYVERLIEGLGKGINQAKKDWGGSDAIKALKDAMGKGELHQLLDDTNGFTKTVEFVLNAVNSHLNAYLHKDSKLTKALITDLTNELNEKLPDLKNERADTATHVRINKDVFKQYNAHIDQDRLSELHLGKAEGGPRENQLPQTIKNIESEINKSEKYLGKVEEESGKDQKKFYKNTFQSLLDTVTDNLSTLMTTIRDLVDTIDGEKSGKKNGVKVYFQELEKMLAENGPNGASDDQIKSLDGIKTRIEKILGNDSDRQNQPNDLRTIIENAAALMRTMEQKSQQTIREIQETVSAQVKEKINNITDQAEKQYIDSRIHELGILNTVIKKQHGVITELIYQDGISGMKGFLRRLQKYFVESLRTYLIPTPVQQKSGLQPPTFAEPLDEFAFKLNTWFTLFCQQVKHSSFHDRLYPMFTSLHILLKRIGDSKHFDYLVIGRLLEFKKTVNDCPAETLFDSAKKILSPLKAGLANFAEQLGHAYVNRYSGRKMGELLKKVEDSESKKAAPVRKQPSEEKYDLTPEGRNCAKVCLTIVEMVGHDLKEFFNNCKEGGGWRKDKINLHTELGKYFASCDYRVSKETKSQEGELNNSYALSGKFAIRGVHNFMKETENGYLDVLLKYLNAYYRVCHLSTFSSTRHPTSVHQMLVWLAGLPHTPTYDDFSLNAFSSLFEKKDKQVKEGKKPDDASTTVLVQDVSSEGDNPIIKIGDDDILDAYPHRIAAMNLSDTLAAVCTHAHSVLTAIQGHGHADGTYACDYNTNSYTLSYPNDNGACIDMLVDISSRLHEQLFFLLIQCQRGWKCNSWRECWYGQGIAGSSWTCNEKQCGNQNCPQIADQNANQNANQIARQTCDQHPNCGLKSPLQSFLEDGLQGFLPHRFDKVGCKAKCTVSNHRGLPCKTPMGFQDIGVAASHTQKGEHLMRALEELCGKPDSPLTKLCADLTCLLQQPPQSLGDMFAFYFSFINGWGKNAPLHKSQAFNNAVLEASFGDSSKTLHIAPMFENSKHEPGEKSTHRKGDLYCLYSCDYEGNAQITCGRYMKPISLNTWITFSSKNAGKYLSWIVYLTETFYSYLENLYNECCEKCNKKGTRCHDTRCVKDCHVNSYYEAQESATEPAKAAKQVPASTIQQHEKLCKTIARCPFSRPTLYKYGFVLNSLTNLSGADDMATKRTCGDLCKTLERVLNKKEKDEAPLATLIYRTIPNFLWEIRKPFSYLVLALWLLSFLYLLHIMVIRLDLLHIKSHLHSPSSHRISAQSLLAAARVGRLAKISYLQP